MLFFMDVVVVRNM